MKTVISWAMTTLVFLSLMAVSAIAQDPTELSRMKVELENKVKIETVQTMGAQFSFDARVIKGAPYSATSETETIQLLADGNRIRNKATTMVYRDSEGRTRREVVGKSPDLVSQVFINDPTSSTNYTLDPQQRTAVKAQRSIAIRTVEGKLLAERKMNAGAVEPVKIVTVNGKGIESVLTDESERALVEQKMRREKEVMAANIKNTAGTLMLKKKDGVEESLGRRMIEGVMCEGKRTTVTIPAGTIGNDLPINIVSEEWYSPELQVLVLTRRHDPRSGENIYRLTNINRAEPSHALFEVPVDYTLKDSVAMPMKKIVREEPE